MFVKWLWGVIWTGTVILKIKVIKKKDTVFILLLIVSWNNLYFTYLSSALCENCILWAGLLAASKISFFL